MLASDTDPPTELCHVSPLGLLTIVAIVVVVAVLHPARHYVAPD